MSERIRVENLYKVFARKPGRAMAMLAQGATKDEVLAATGAVVGLNGVSLSIPSGAITMIMGLSGSGKSTLARCLNRLNEPTSGRILLDGEDIVPMNDAALREVRRTRMSMVFQHFALFPHRTVAQNVEFGLKLRGVERKTRQARARDVLETVGLSQWADRRPDQLSGGMRQRVGLARALATEADVLIMDEAFSALDPLIRSEMQDELLRLQRVLHKTILFITHDFQEALKLGTQVAIMADGTVVREGTPQSIVLDPASDFVAAFTRDIDRSRLLDVASAMDGLKVVARGLQGRTAVSDAFLVDGNGRPTRVVRGPDVAKVIGGADPVKLSSDQFAYIAATSKLIDAARYCRPGRLIAVVDERGVLVGTVCADTILASIARPVSTGTGYA